jgi:hypothetical protein
MMKTLSRLFLNLAATFCLFLQTANGQVVRALPGKGDAEIPVGDLPQGIYWLEVRGARWVFGEKILKKISISPQRRGDAGKILFCW